MPKSTELSTARAAAMVLSVYLIASSATAVAQDSAAKDQTVPPVPAESTQASPDGQTSPGPSTAAEPDSGESGTTNQNRESSAPAAPARSTDNVGQETVPTIPVAESSHKDAAPVGAATQLEDIVVTATKREKSLRDIPASISAFDGDQLENQGKLGLNDYLQQKPGVTLAEIAPDLIRITVRGISTDSNPTSPLPSATGVLVNDVAFTDAYIANVQPDLSAFDLSSVELLKGPQGTLFGGAALSGAIRFVLQDPEMGEWKARSFTQFNSPTGGSSAFTSGVALNAPLYSDRLALRLGYIKRNYPGVTNWTRAPEQDDVDKGGGKQLRGILSWRPLDPLTLKLTHLQQDFAAGNEITVADTPQRRETNRQLLPRPTDNNFKMDALQLAYDFDAVRVVSLTSRIAKNWNLYSDVTSVINGPPPQGASQQGGAFLTVIDDSKAFSQELRLQSTGTSGFQWLVGAYYYNFNVYFSELIDTIAHQQVFGSSGFPGHVSYDNNVTKTSVLYAVTQPKAFEKALFFDLTQTLWNRLELSAGARLYRTRVHGGFHGTGVLAEAENNGMDIDYSNNDISEKGVSPKLSAIFHFTPSFSSYLLASRGFRFGGLQSVPSTPGNNVPPEYKSDTLWNYEWGFRTAWLGNTLHFDPALFYISYNNPQIGQTTNGIPLGYTTNVGHAESRGAEANLRWLTPLPGLIAEVNAGVTDAHTTVPFTASDGTVIQPGASLPGGAKSQYSAAVDYLIPYISVVTIGAHFDYSYIGKGFADIQGRHPVNDYGTLNAGLMFTTSFRDVQPKLALNISNIRNVTKATWGETTKPLTGPSYDTWTLNPPRTFTARLSFDF